MFTGEVNILIVIRRNVMVKGCVCQKHEGMKIYLVFIIKVNEE